MIWPLLLAGERPKKKPLGRGRTGDGAAVPFATRFSGERDDVHFIVAHPLHIPVFEIVRLLKTARAAYVLRREVLATAAGLPRRLAGLAFYRETVATRCSSTTSGLVGPV